MDTLAHYLQRVAALGASNDAKFPIRWALQFYPFLSHGSGTSLCTRMPLAQHRTRQLLFVADWSLLEVEATALECWKLFLRAIDRFFAYRHRLANVAAHTARLCRGRGCGSNMFLVCCFLFLAACCFWCPVFCCGHSIYGFLCLSFLFMAFYFLFVECV